MSDEGLYDRIARMRQEGVQSGWMPEVGQECEGTAESGVTFECRILGVFLGAYPEAKCIVFQYEDGGIEAATEGNSYTFSPIQAVADKLREKQPLCEDEGCPNYGAPHVCNPEKWIPEVGQECIYPDSVDGDVVTTPIAVKEVRKGEIEVWHRRKDGGLLHGDMTNSVDSVSFFRPIPTKADKMREEQKDMIGRIFAMHLLEGEEQTVEAILDAGFRMTRPLTDEVIRLRACARFSGTGVVAQDVYDFAKAIAAYVTGEEL